MKPSPGLDILNTGTGHTEIRFDQGNPMETDRAKRMITDMLRRGYVLFVEEEAGKPIRVESFNPERGVYIVSDVPGVSAPEEKPKEQEEPSYVEEAPQKKKPGSPRKEREIPVESVRATAIGRSAGG